MSQANPPKNLPQGIRWGWIILGLAVIALSVGILIKGMEGGIQYYMTVSEYVGNEAKYEGRKIKLAGIVKLGSLEVNADHYEFVVEDLGKSIAVSYIGLAPDTFKEGVEVVVEGRAKNEAVFEANYLMAKCASKYEAGGLPPLEKMRGKSIY